MLSGNNNGNHEKHHELKLQYIWSLFRMQVTHANLSHSLDLLAPFYEGSSAAGKHVIMTTQEKGRHWQRDRERLIRRRNCTRQRQERPDKNTHAYNYRYDCDCKSGPV
jgi:hypothetical protein